MQAFDVLPVGGLGQNANLKAIEGHRNVGRILAALEVDTGRTGRTGYGHLNVLVCLERDIRVVAHNIILKVEIVPQPVVGAVVDAALEGVAGAGDGKGAGKPVFVHVYRPQALPVKARVIVELALHPLAVDGVGESAVDGRPLFFRCPA